MEPQWTEVYAGEAKWQVLVEDRLKKVEIPCRIRDNAGPLTNYGRAAPTEVCVFVPPAYAEQALHVIEQLKKEIPEAFEAVPLMKIAAAPESVASPYGWIYFGMIFAMLGAGMATGILHGWLFAIPGAIAGFGLGCGLEAFFRSRLRAKSGPTQQI